MRNPYTKITKKLTDEEIKAIINKNKPFYDGLTKIVNNFTKGSK